MIDYNCFHKIGVKSQGGHSHEKYFGNSITCVCGIWCKVGSDLQKIMLPC